MKLTSQRRLLKLTGGRGSIAKMSTERQRLSFFLVVIFLAVFGLIVLAEVFFVDKEVLGFSGQRVKTNLRASYMDGPQEAMPPSLLLR